MAAILLLVLLAPSLAMHTHMTTLDRDQAESLKERPIAKVVRMLKDMKTELETEMEDDKAVYEKLRCWCETGMKEKEQAIEEGKANIARLEADLEEYAGKISELKAKIGDTKDAYNKNWAGNNDAAGMRMKENKEFHEQETDLLGAIQSMEQALTVLSKHHPELAQVRSITHVLQSLPPSLVAGSSLSGSQVGVFKSFLQKAEKADSFLAIPGMQSYAPQSGQIVGILKQLKEDLEGDLKELQEGEAKAVAEYESTKAAKEGEMSEGKKAQEEAETELASYMEKQAQASEELADTEEQVKTDETFLANLKKMCAKADKEFEARMKSRTAEIAAVQDTIGYLNSDEAFEAFDKTVNTAFVQTNSVTAASLQEKWTRAKIVKALTRVASPRLVMLVTSARLDAFTKVKAEIDKMISELKKQQADEIKQRDWCIAELDKTNLTMEAKYDEQANLQAKIADLESTIEQLTKDIKTKKEEIADMQTQMKRGSEDREGENADFQQTVSDQRITQTILQKALDRMAQVYALLQRRRAMQARTAELLELGAKQPGAPHIQTSATDTDPGNGPARFKEYEQNAGGKKVLKLIQDVIDDSKKTEAEAIAAEQDSQTAYENFMKDSNKAITENTKAITNMSEELGKAKEDLVAANEDFTAVNQELSDLHDTDTSLHESCDYLLKNFEVRQAARADEIDALNEAKAILSGAK